ncbi:MAG: TIGR00296 family protein [Candidatus Hodarchaeaceae archaeon]|nr:TIGR00296 family protein [Candidatus Hodarchaeaceae archaeon]
MLSLEEGTLLVRTARRTIETYLRERRKPSAPKVPPKLREPRGVFVTLIKGGELRGCIGHPLPTTPLIDAVIDSAISSATRDPRFPPMVPEELTEVEVEVSALTKPEPIKVKTPREYPEHVVIGRDGLIVECGGYAGLLLPQVAVEWGWDSEEFLSQTCLKAGLPPDSWLDKDVQIRKFSAQVFREKGPRGEVEERKLTEKT